jgi:hypothetical protein
MGEIMAGGTVTGRRAVDDAEKREILDRLYQVWTTDGNRFMRLGQLIGNIYHSTDHGGANLYQTEDYELIETMENAYRLYWAEHREALKKRKDEAD